MIFRARKLLGAGDAYYVSDDISRPPVGNGTDLAMIYATMESLNPKDLAEELYRAVDGVVPCTSVAMWNPAARTWELAVKNRETNTVALNRVPGNA